MSERTVTETRLAIRANGYDPLPACGKEVFLPGWPTKTNVPPEEITSWGKEHPRWNNNGMLTRPTPVFDSDITDPEAAEAVDNVLHDWFGNRGALLTQIGQAPKRATLFRTDKPFAKLQKWFVAPNGKSQNLEFLGDGQQLIVGGIHPDTKEPYRWRDNRGPDVVPRSALPEINGEEAKDFLGYVADMLKEKFNYCETEPPKRNGHDPHGHDDPDIRDKAPVDIEAEFASIRDGASANQVQPRVIASMLRKGMHPDEVLKYVAGATVKVANHHGLDWTLAKEIVFVRRRIVSAYTNLLLKDYDPSTGMVPDWLPGEFHQDWIARLQQGRKPAIGFNPGGFYVRSRQDPALKAAATSDTAADDADQKSDSAPHANEKKETSTSKPPRIILRPFEPFDVAQLPARSWLYGKHYQRRTVSLTAGPGGMGKSSLDLVEAVAMATGRKLLGEQPEERLRVWYHNGEDPLEEIKRRIAAICQHYSIPMEELTGFLFITSGNEFPLRVAKGYASLEIDTELLLQISACISDREIDVAIFDPLVTLHSVSEIDTGKMDTVIRLFAGIADENDAAIELAHHVRKPAAGSSADYDVHDIRGVTAITDAVRAARLLNRMNEKDAEAAGCDERERLSRFRVDRAKGNYSPAQAATWRQFVNVDLVNGDEVGVVVRWDFPGQGEQNPQKAAADQKAEHVFMQLLDKFLARGQNVSANSGPTYAPARFAEEREAKTAEVSKAALKAAMGRLLDANRIKAEATGRGDRYSRLIPWHGAPQ